MLPRGSEEQSFKGSTGIGAMPRASNTFGSLPVLGLKAPGRAGRGQMYGEGEGCLPEAIAFTAECSQLTTGGSAGREQCHQCQDLVLSPDQARSAVSASHWPVPPGAGQTACLGQDRDRKMGLEEWWRCIASQRVKEPAVPISMPWGPSGGQGARQAAARVGLSGASLAWVP